MISAKPNTPMATTAKSMPSCNSGMPKSKRATPEFTSVPTMPSSKPSRIMQMALGSEPEASTTAPIRPSTIRQKYSAGPNLKATSARGGAKPANSPGAQQPGKEQPKE